MTYMPKHILNTAPRHVQAMVREMAETKAITTKHIIDRLPGVNRHHVKLWLRGDSHRLAEGTIDRILEVVVKA